MIPITALGLGTSIISRVACLKLLKDQTLLSLLIGVLICWPPALYVTDGKFMVGVWGDADSMCCLGILALNLAAGWFYP